MICLAYASPRGREAFAFGPDLLLRRSVCAAGQPAYSQVRRRIRLSASDRKFPSLTGRSGTQRARRLLSRTTVGSSAPWSSSPLSDLRYCLRCRRGGRTRSDQFVTSGLVSLAVVHAGPEHPKVVHPRGCQRGSPAAGPRSRRPRHRRPVRGRGGFLGAPAVPSDLGETYESVYNLIRRGGVMPHQGCWITGEGIATA